MAVTFIEKKKRQRILILALLGVLFLIAGVVWWGFFASSPPKIQSVPSLERRVELDISILSHPALQGLDEPRGPIQVLPKVGRDNPFLPAK